MITSHKENDRALQSFFSAGFTKPQLIILGAAGFIALFFLLGFLGVIPIFREDIRLSQVELEFWGVGDDQSDWNDTINKFESMYPNVNIKYTKLDQVNYEKHLLNALAAGAGPDVFMFHNTWASKHANKIVPVSSDKIPLSTFRNLFPVIAEQDFVRDDQILALPVSVDTLALFYDRDVFDNKLITVAPATWDGLRTTILRVRELRSGGGISKAGIAMGGTIKSIPNAVDILNLLLLQYKTGIVTSDGSRMAIANAQGIKALNFYTQFSNPKSAYYTWADSFKPPVSSFTGKQVSMILAYAADIPEIKAKNPVLNFVIAPAPQLNKDEAVNFANYWGLAVSAENAYSNAAWDFIIFATTDIGVARSYIINTGKPPAMRYLISEYLTSPTLGVFAAQALTARSWPQPDSSEVKRVFNDMIGSVITNKLSSEKALRGAENELNALMEH